MGKLALIEDKHNLTAALLAYKEIVHSIPLFLAKSPRFKKRDYIPNSEYANYHIAASYVQRIGLFDKNLQRHVAQFMIGQDFPKEDSETIFAQHTPGAAC